jgi:hypothetical protein
MPTPGDEHHEHLSQGDRLSLIEYKVLALSLHVQRLEAMLSTIVTAGNEPSLTQMRSRLSVIDGLWSVLPIETMSEAKAREMLGDGKDPRVHGSIEELLKLN